MIGHLGPEHAIPDLRSATPFMPAGTAVPPDSCRPANSSPRSIPTSHTTRSGPPIPSRTWRERPMSEHDDQDPIQEFMLQQSEPPQVPRRSALAAGGLAFGGLPRRLHGQGGGCRPLESRPPDRGTDGRGSPTGRSTSTPKPTKTSKKPPGSRPSTPRISTTTTSFSPRSASP